jgi:primosomal replication protein N
LAHAAAALSTAAVNRWTITARLVRQGSLRYTPAGLKVQELGFQFTGAAVEAGFERQLNFEFEAIAVGDVAGQLAELALGSELALTGFFAPVSKRAKRLRLHITDFTRH